MQDLFNKTKIRKVNLYLQTKIYTHQRDNLSLNKMIFKQRKLSKHHIGDIVALHKYAYFGDLLKRVFKREFRDS